MNLRSYSLAGLCLVVCINAQAASEEGKTTCQAGQICPTSGSSMMQAKTSQEKSKFDQQKAIKAIEKDAKPKVLNQGSSAQAALGLVEDDHSLIGLSGASQQVGMLTFSRKDGKKYCLAWEHDKSTVSLQKWPCVGFSYRYLWTLESNGMIKPNGVAKCLDVGPDRMDYSTDWEYVSDVSLQDCNPANAQNFYFRGGWELNLKGRKRQCSYIQIDLQGKGQAKCYDHMGSDDGYRWAFETVVTSW